MRCLLKALILLCVLASPALSQERPVFKKWTLAQDKNEDGVSLRIYADSEAKEAPGGMIVYRDAGQCSTAHVVFAAMTKKKGKDTDWTQGAMRVDEKEVHTFKYRCTFPKDNGLAYAYIKEVSNGSGLLEELGRGQYVRVKLSMHGEDYIMRFPLAGYAEASAKQVDVCSTLPASAKKPSKEGQSERREKKREGGFGTGFFVNAEGYVITNFHVVDAGKKIQVEYQNNKHDAKVIKVDPTNDLALLKVDIAPKTFLNFRGGKQVKTGEDVVAIGFPFYGMVSTHPNITTGTISSVVGLGDDSRLLQTTAPVQPGNSGGPLLDSSGNVVGVVVSKLDAVAVVKATGDIPQNINFAIRPPIVKSFLEINDVVFHTAESDQDLKVVDIGEKSLPGVVLVVALP